MRKIKSISIPICMFGLFAGCVQYLLILRMGFLDLLSTPFFYGILLLMFGMLIVSYFKKIRTLFISTAIFMIAFMSVKLFLKHIEDYYFQRSVSKGDILKTDLEAYKGVHKAYPENLKELYKETHAPQYNIGLLKYNFSYRKTGTGYRLYFYHFDGSIFSNYGHGCDWNFSD